MSKIELRWYQSEAVEAVFDYFGRRTGNPVIEIPTGGGKAYVNAAIIDSALKPYPQTRFLCLTHVKELIEQNFKSLLNYNPDMTFKAGINSAGLGRREYSKQVLFAGIQSVHKHAKKIGHVDLIIIDEAHLVPHKSEGMYREFIDDLKAINPYLKVIGLTATPYRLNGGMLTEGGSKLFSSICYKVDILRMIKEGYLSQLVTRSGARQYDTAGVGQRGGEFIQSELAARIEASDDITADAVSEMISVAKEQDRRHWIVFASSVEHAQDIASLVQAHDVSCGIVTGDTDKGERARLIDAFKRGALTCLVNVAVLTTGFDAPHVDLVCLMRPTQSPGLYVQILGRGLRIAEGKHDCLVLDYGGNIERHGPINAIKPPRARGSGGGQAPVKMCENCSYDSVPAGCRNCPECGHEFEFSTDGSGGGLQGSASTMEVVRTEFPWFDVADVHYSRHQKSGKPDSLRVDYISKIGHRLCSEWICLEHQGFALRKATEWISARTGEDLFPPIENVSDAMEFCDQIARPSRIQIDDSGDFDRIISYDFENSEDVSSSTENMHARGSDLSFSVDSGGTADDDGFYDDDLPF